MPHANAAWVDWFEKETNLDASKFIRAREPRQPRRLALTAADKRQILGASLRLLILRHEAGLPIFQSDVIRAARFSDDADLESVWNRLLASPPAPGAAEDSEAGRWLEST